jgi:hypothetical protein
MATQNRARKAGPVIFRNSYVHYRTGKLVVAKPGRPFPIPVGKRKTAPRKATFPPPRTVRPPRPPARVRTLPPQRKPGRPRS